LIGFQKATALMMTGDKVDAIEAERIGMIYKYFPIATFEDEVVKLAFKMAKMPTKGLGLTKRVLNESLTNTLQEQLSLESKYQIEAAQTNDYSEGVNAFVEKRKPNFIGK
jgi:2-(1,2-epoxy-1,2-dihydrophenyl)acetyl-CoA isomerase